MTKTLFVGEPGQRCARAPQISPTGRLERPPHFFYRVVWPQSAARRQSMAVVLKNFDACSREVLHCMASYATVIVIVIPSSSSPSSWSSSSSSSSRLDSHRSPCLHFPWSVGSQVPTRSKISLRRCMEPAGSRAQLPRSWQLLPAEHENVVYLYLSPSSDEHHLLHNCLGTGMRVGT